MLNQHLNIEGLLKEVQKIASMVVEQEAIETLMMDTEELRSYYQKRFGGGVMERLNGED